MYLITHFKYLYFNYLTTLQTNTQRVSECVDLYGAYSLRTPSALDALVTREQVRFK